MIPVGHATRIFLATGPTDMRKSFEGLSDLVRSRLKADPLSGHLFVFANRRKTRLKLLYLGWQRNLGLRKTARSGLLSVAVP